MGRDLFIVSITTVVACVIGSYFYLVLQREIARLRAAIRAHRDARGNDRCWLDDETLYRTLGDEHEAVTVLPTKDVFLTNCARFHENRQHPYHLSLFRDTFPDGASPPRSEEKR